MLSHFSDLLLIAAASAAVLLLAGLVHSLFSRRRQLQEVRSYADAVERLQAIATAISGKLGSGQRLLDELAVAAGQICGMSHVMICVLDTHEPSGEAILRRVAAVCWPASYGPVFFVHQLHGTREAVEQGKTIITSLSDPAGHSLDLLRSHGLSSMVLIPLLVEEKVIGLLSMCDARDHVTPAQERLAKLWGAQAAVILAHTKLYEQTQRALRAQRQLTEQREQLSSITAAIYAQKNFELTLQSIVKLVPPVLGVDGAAVLMCENRCDDLTIVAATAPNDRLIGRRFPTNADRMRERFEQRVAAVVPDVSKDPGRSPIWSAVQNVASYISMPLFHSDQRPLGLLMLLRQTPGPFSQEQLELAQVFAARAAAAIENSQLNQQARADARTNAMLLRELNHRVKNNLAGIAGLLETAEAEVSSASRPVVARLARRVRVMADAHQLFVGGVVAITVAQLVEQVLASMAVEHVQESHVNLELSAVANVQLRTDRAVSLAMVLHELMYNAIAHGCGATGQLNITGRLGAGEKPTLAVEVADDGTLANAELGDWVALPGTGGAIAIIEGPPRAGIGLHLVRGLVRRELKGTFSVSPQPQGGTRATVEFPLAPDELKEQTK